MTGGTGAGMRCLPSVPAMLSDLDQIRAWTIAAYREAEQSRLARAARALADDPPAPSGDPGADLGAPLDGAAHGAELVVGQGHRAG